MSSETWPDLSEYGVHVAPASFSPMNQAMRELNPASGSMTHSQAREAAEDTGLCSDGSPCGAPHFPEDDAYCLGCPNAPRDSEPLMPKGSRLTRGFVKRDRDDMLTCACGDMYPVRSYGAGFMAANGGVCENCDAAEPAGDDPVNHPGHYQSEDGIECIDAIRAALGLEGFVAHCRGTAIKYAWRSGKKQKHAEDLLKAAWYLTKAAEELEQ